MQAPLSLPLDPRICEQARLSRDARFDGLFFTAVSSTGIFCRPVCPAPAPKPRHVTYFPSAASAAAAGFRPCLRCRPERAPGTSSWRSGSELVAGALRLIDDGVLDDAPVAALATRVGVGERHLRRLFAETLGASPLQVAATRRLLFAKQLLGETALGMTDIALAAGYGSARRFNATFSAAYGMAPRDVRRGRALARDGDELQLRLPYRPPYDLGGLLAFFARRALPGVEGVDAHSYRRSFVLRGSPGTFEVRALADEPALLLSVRHAQVQALPEIVNRVRRQFDLDADPATIAGVLRRDRQLAPVLRRFPGVRVPGCWDGFEIAVRAVLGQQVSVAAARTLAARLVQRWGAAFELADGATATAFPSPGVLADVDLTAIGVTRSRAQTIRTLARAVGDGRVAFRPEQGLDAFVDAWTQLPGIGAWTAHYIAMRALGHPDAFPAADLILRKVAGNGVAVPTRELEQRSQAWRPWRSYATLLLWRASA
ncbi:MAG TPA: AlkA N-terminal domain-containing protein [Rhodanobacteraceae bacterium]|nr:AlkA N-terminal domain-containing protein [Rhodanobacteraceae bacterium]